MKLYKLVRIEPYSDEDMAHAAFDRRELRRLKRATTYRPPPSALVPAPPPDYSTPAKVSARCRERGSGAGADIREASNDRSFAKLYKEFRKLVPARSANGSRKTLKRNVVDWHVSRVKPATIREARLSDAS